MDRTSMLARFLDDEALLREMVTRLTALVPQDLDAMRTAATAGDVETIHRRAHSLKGALGLFGSGTAFDVVSRLESVSRSGDLEASVRDLETLSGELEQLLAELQALVPPTSGPS